MKKKTILLFGVLLFAASGLVLSQSDAQKYYLTHANQRLGLTAIGFSDPYMSVLGYSGVGAVYSADATRFFKAENPVLSQTSNIFGILGITNNPESTASAIYMDAGASWGVQYHYRGPEDFLFLGGANLGGDLNYKMNSRNVNNPVSIIASANLNLTFGGKYFVHTKKRIIKLNFMFEAPVLGCMFVMPQGMTVYEFSKNPDLKNTLHFTHLMNKQGLKQQYSVEIPFRYSTWTFGMDSRKLSFQANDHIYTIFEAGYYVGLSYDLYKFAGRKRPVPGNFISPQL